MKTQLHFVTSNESKFREYKNRIDSNNAFELLHLNFELVESQNLDIKKIAEHKLNEAKRHFPNKKILIDDRGFFVKSLNNFPGPYLKMVLKSIGVEGILKLMDGVSDRSAQFISVLGYFDGVSNHFFYDVEEGFVNEVKKGNNLRGWTELLYVYGYNLYPNKTLAEYSDFEWSSYINELGKTDFINQFLKHIAENE